MVVSCSFSYNRKDWAKSKYYAGGPLVTTPARIESIETGIGAEHADESRLVPCPNLFGARRKAAKARGRSDTKQVMVEGSGQQAAEREGAGLSAGAPPAVRSKSKLAAPILIW
jgi:hypothetical protein